MTGMTIEEAKKILTKMDAFMEDGTLRYLRWCEDGSEAELDGTFTADELEAIAVYMRANQ